MGVYIKNMEMPKGCAFCQIGKRNGKKMVCPLCDEELDISDPMSADHRLAYCPLVPVQGNGRPVWKHGVCQTCFFDWSKVAPLASVPNFCPNCGALMEDRKE